MDIINKIMYAASVASIARKMANDNTNIRIMHHRQDDEEFKNEEVNLGIEIYFPGFNRISQESGTKRSHKGFASLTQRSQPVSARITLMVLIWHTLSANNHTIPLETSNRLSPVLVRYPPFNRPTYLCIKHSPQTRILQIGLDTTTTKLALHIRIRSSFTTVKPTDNQGCVKYSWKIRRQNPHPSRDESKKSKWLNPYFHSISISYALS